MVEKVSAGRPIPRSAALWDNIIGAANEYAGRSAARPSAAGGSGAPAAGVVKIKNSTTSHVRLGEVLEISGFLLSNVVRSHLWFDGASPDGTRPFVIAMQDIPVGTIDCAIAAGVCVALVNVTDSTHGYADTLSGSSALQSEEVGPIRILYKPSGSGGELLCAVSFSPAFDTPSALKQHCRFTLGAALATTDATKAATIATQYGPGEDHESTSITVRNLLTHTAGTYAFEGDSGDAGIAIYDAGTTWNIVQMECP